MGCKQFAHKQTLLKKTTTFIMYIFLVILENSIFINLNYSKIQ